MTDAPHSRRLPEPTEPTERTVRNLRRVTYLYLERPMTSIWSPEPFEADDGTVPFERFINDLQVHRSRHSD